MTKFKINDHVKIKADCKDGALVGCGNMIRRLNNTTGTVVGILDGSYLIKCDVMSRSIDSDTWAFFPRELEPLNNG